MEKSKVISLLKRFATSVVLIPAVICCVLSGYPLILLLAWLGAVLMSWEWADMVKNTKPSIYALIYFFVVAWCLVFDFSILTFIIIFGAMLFVFLKSKNEEHRWLLTMGVPYIGIGLGSVLAIYNSAGPLVVLWFMFVVWAVDIGGFCFGCTIKGPKLAPRISPNKTWSGFCGGMLLAVAISSAFCWYLGAEPLLVYAGALSVGIAVIAQIGDLLESAVKRHLNIKDSSNLIPGHGGIFDRVDGLIFAAPFAYLALFLLNIFVE